MFMAYSLSEENDLRGQHLRTAAQLFKGSKQTVGLSQSLLTKLGIGSIFRLFSLNIPDIRLKNRKNRSQFQFCS